MNADRFLKVWINPLCFLDAELPRGAPTMASVMEYLCRPDSSSRTQLRPEVTTGKREDLPSSDVEVLVRRYREISTEPVPLSVAPLEDRLLEKLVWPLRHAKASYMLGNYIGTISLCGMVAEMVAILLWELADIQHNGQKMDLKVQKAVFGREFEDLGQERRVQVLAAYGLIDQPIQDAFNQIRGLRNSYLHLWSRDLERLPKEAIATFRAAVSLVVRAIGQDFSEGNFVLNPQLASYLKRKGTFVPEAED